VEILCLVTVSLLVQQPFSLYQSGTFAEIYRDHNTGKMAKDDSKLNDYMKSKRITNTLI